MIKADGESERKSELAKPFRGRGTSFTSDRSHKKSSSLHHHDRNISFNCSFFAVSAGLRLAVSFIFLSFRIVVDSMASKEGCCEAHAGQFVSSRVGSAKIGYHCHRIGFRRLCVRKSAGPGWTACFAFGTTLSDGWMHTYLPRGGP